MLSPNYQSKNLLSLAQLPFTKLDNINELQMYVANKDKDTPFIIIVDDKQNDKETVNFLNLERVHARHKKILWICIFHDIVNAENTSHVNIRRSSNAIIIMVRNNQDGISQYVRLLKTDKNAQYLKTVFNDSDPDKLMDWVLHVPAERKFYGDDLALIPTTYQNGNKDDDDE
jgi:hypothetical protein